MQSSTPYYDWLQGYEADMNVFQTDGRTDRTINIGRQPHSGGILIKQYFKFPPGASNM
jgi:hypothetical protein